jgi:hypothetical protein
MIYIRYELDNIKLEPINYNTLLTCDPDANIVVFELPFNERFNEETILKISDKYVFDQSKIITNISYPAGWGWPDFDNSQNSILGQLMLKEGPDILCLKRISFGKAITTDEDTIFYHTCPTMYGSTGSPIIDVYTGCIIGIHIGKIVNKSKNIHSKMVNFAIHYDILYRLTEKRINDVL